MAKEVEIKVFGLVQGVMFRMFAKTEADRRGIIGWAKNLPDGSVGIMAQGEDSALREFIERMSVGPAGAEVESLDVRWKKDEAKKQNFSDFSIL